MEIVLNAFLLVLGSNCCAQVTGVLDFLANPTHLQELEENSHILANLCNINQALGIYFCNGIKKVTCRTRGSLTLHRLCVPVPAVQQQLCGELCCLFL